tara:strand:+ start:338 stop:631 length:294 start_codon:yes stop_codon:yes gene_type:complete
MLIETPYAVGDTISIKISSGEEMVARLEAIKDEAILVKKPFMLVAGQKGPGLAPFMFTVAPDASYELKLNTIICIVKTAKDASDMYIKATTGLTVAG